MPTPPAPPVLSDGVVTLRAHEPADVEPVVEQSVDGDSLRWTRVPRPYGRDDAEGWLRSMREAWQAPDGARAWAIEHTDASGRTRYAGTVDLRPAVPPTVGELGFGLHPAARGHGLMARAVRLVLAHAFDDGAWGRPLTRVRWSAIRGNWGSRRVAWATGFGGWATVPESHPDPDGGPHALDRWTATIAAGDPLTPVAPWLDAPVLTADGLRLRPWRADDVEAVEPRDDDPHHWMPARAVLGRDTFAAWLQVRRERMAEGTAVDWCVADASSDRALGGVTLFSRAGAIDPDHGGDTAELGYQLFPSARGRGVAKAAARLATAHAFRPRAEGGLGLRRLVAETAADNAASNGVLTATGFTAWGREHAVDLTAEGTWGDGLHWELLPHA